MVSGFSGEHAEKGIEAAAQVPTAARLTAIRQILTEIEAREQKEIETFRSEMFKRDYLKRIKPFPAVRTLVQRCREAGLTIALASSGHADEVKVYTEIAGIGDLVDVTTTSSDVAHSKPCPDIFQAALEKCAPATGRPTR